MPQKSSDKSYVISVDLGGTNLRVGAVRESGAVEFRERLPSESRSESSVILERVAQAVKKVAQQIETQKGTVAGVSLGFPGIVDVTEGVVYQSPHFPDWKDLGVLDFFKKQFSWPVALDNDANLIALGEAWMGAGQELKNFVLLTLGTGVGGGIVINRQVWRGDRGFAGELGHICISAEGEECGCGSRGCLEMYVSATGISRLIEKSDHADGREALLERLGKPLARMTIQDLHEAALDGDIFANTIFKKMGFYLGIGVASVVNVLGMENVILGGGVAQAWDFFIEPTKKELAQRTYAETAKRVQFHRAQLGDDAGLIGGAAAFFKK